MGDVEIYTVTMARVYEGQGYLGKAADIYRHLLAQNPGNELLSTSLTRVEELLYKDNPRGQQTRQLLGQWIRLLLRYRNLCKLKVI